MAFPSIVNSATSNNGSAAATNKSVTVPAYQANDIILITLRSFGSDSHTTPSGYTALVANNTADASDDVTSIWYRIASGSSSGETLTVTCTTSRKYGASCLIIRGGLAPQVSSVVVGTSTNPDPPALTPSGGAQDYLWLAIVGTEGTQTFTADPSGYTHVHTVSTTGSTAATNGSVRVVSRQLNASSQDPGTFTMSASEDWTAVTIAIPPSDTSTPVSLSDSLVPVLGESAGSLVSLSGSDSFSSLLADAALAAVSFSTSDTAGPSLAETIAFLFDRAVSDTLQPQLTEAASSGVSLGASDSLSPSLAESASSLVSTSRSDSFSDLLAETVLSGVSVAASDSVSPSLGEAVALLLGITVADGLQPQLSDAAASGVSLGASDSLSPLLSESLQSLAGVSAADSLQPQLAESLAALVSRAVSDSIEVSESVSVEVLLSLSDSASLSDSSTLLVLLGPVDSIVSLAEQSHIQTSASDELSLSDSIIPLLDEAANISRVLGDELQISIGEELFALVSVSASDVAVSSLIETLLLEQYRRSIQLGVAGANLTLAGRPSIGGTGILAVQGGAYADTNHGALPVPQV